MITTVTAKDIWELKHHISFDYAICMTVWSSIVKDESDQIDGELVRKGELLADTVQAADVSRTSWSHMMAQIICGHSHTMATTIDMGRGRAQDMAEASRTA